MNTAPRPAEPETLTPEALERRREVYVRYAAVLRAQLAALDEQDLDRFHQLAEERDALAAGLDAPAPPGPIRGATAEPTAAAEVERILAEVRALLGECARTDQRVRERLEQLRDRTMRELRDLDGRKPGIRRYLQPGAPPARLDVRL